MYIKFNAIQVSCFLLVTQLFILNSCSTPKQTTVISVPINDDKKIDKPSEVLTIILKVHNSDGREQTVFEINDIIKKEGYYKKMRNRNEKGYYKATITNRAGGMIDSCFFENPLQQRLEYSEDDGKMASEVLKKQEGYTSIRVNYTSDVNTLNIYDDSGKKVGSFNISNGSK